MKVCSKHDGFTLLEMVVTIATLSLLAMLLTPYLSLSVQAYNENALESNVLGELRYATERITRELREIRRNPSSLSDYEVSTPLVVGSISFVRNDGETVTIEDASPQLNMRYASVAANAAFPLSNSLQLLTFNYLRNDEVTPATGSSDLAYIEFEIQLSSNGKTYSQRSRVSLRAQP
ncbi:prepilin-type N-terminal cleavage/methylation domain-containing protein [Thiogranum longum]|uniref:Prepilin-type N-terminal cleavage/methylation domain-containing protein n=1 Tax=Thiogranum longum TaxID=1537524 RepID=A0A4R1H592_9GAMM|nr:prepilin-type N-terminal cleavage/methylation domain-containing protein [Thiogranum longum]TCK16877.1 prepilin-type N-terminal cleavage/methylation domain-containing protein [Thiogranum longum]